MSYRSPFLPFMILLVFSQSSFGQVDANLLADQRAQNDRNGRWIELREKGGLTYQKSVQEELRLSAEQIVNLRRIFGKVAPNELQFRQLLQPAAPDDKTALNKKIDDYFEDIDAAVANILNADQSQRLQQINLQSLGGSALVRPANAKALELSSQQLSQARRLNLDLIRLGIPPRPGAGENQQNNEEAKKKINEQLLGLLNEEQKEKWGKFLGKPFEFHPDEIRDARRAMTDGDRPARPDRSSTDLRLIHHIKMTLLSKESVRKELQLTDSQNVILNDAQSKFKELIKAGNKIASEREKYREERAQIAAGTELAINKAITENLTADQLRRLQELYLQYQGTRVLDQPDTAKAIGLEDRQLTDVRNINRQLMTEFITALRSKPPEANGQEFGKKLQLAETIRRDAKLLELLTDEQQAKWDQLLGKPFPLDQLRGSEDQSGADQSPPK